jgi:hypothetical protein
VASWVETSRGGRSLVQVQTVAGAVGWCCACHEVVRVGRGGRMVVVDMSVAVALARGCRVRGKHARGPGEA